MSLKDKGKPFDVLFIVQDRYMHTRCGDFLEQSGYDFVRLPRKQNGESLWNEPRSVHVNIWSIVKFYTRILQNFNPELSIILPYEKGAFELAFIRACRKQGYQTLLLQEGLIITDENKESFLGNRSWMHFQAGVTFQQKAQGAINSLLPALGLYLKRRIKSPAVLLDDFRYLPAKIYIRAFLKGYPFGLNGTDYIGTLSNYYLKKLVTRGVEDFKVKAIGLPRFDLIPELLKKTVSHGTDHFVHGESEIWIMYPQVWGYSFGDDFWQDVQSELDFLKSLKSYLKIYNIKITYRLRFEEKISDYSEHISNHPDIRFEKGSDVSAYESILNHDIIISKNSTMILETIALKKYAILNSGNDMYGYGRIGACLVGRDPSEAAAAVVSIISNITQRTSLMENAAKYIHERAMIDGCAATRAVMFIESIINSPKKNVEG